ncbi:MAG TPA: Rnf-Nqr domain containing protein [Mizugakiibacter sp.]
MSTLAASPHDTPAATAADEGPLTGDAWPAALLGLCPLLPACRDATASLALGAALAVVTTIATLMLAVLPQRGLGGNPRTWAALLVFAAAATAAQRVIEAWWPALAPTAMLFVPLIAAHGALLRQAVASHASVYAQMRRGLRWGFGLGALLLALGAARELLGRGTLFADAGALLGTPFLAWQPFADARGLRLATLAPGAFLALALLLAAKQARDLRAAARPSATEVA